METLIYKRWEKTFLRRKIIVVIIESFQHPSQRRVCCKLKDQTKIVKSRVKLQTKNSTLRSRRSR